MSTPPIDPKKSPSISTPSQEVPYQAMMTSFVQSPFKDLVKGIFAGWAEVGVDQPFVTLTKLVQRRLQENSSSTPFWKTITVRQLYAGASANGTGMSIITGVQMWTIGGATQYFAQGQDPQSLPWWQKVSASSMGAVAASPVASFSEMLMDRYRDSIKRYEEQGKKGCRPTYVTTTKEMWKTYQMGMISKGLAHTMGRDIGFVIAYDALASYYKSRLVQNQSFKTMVGQQQMMDVDLVATLVGSIFAGMIGITLTHPLDTRKTRIQAGLNPMLWPNGITPVVNKSLQLLRNHHREQPTNLNLRLFEATHYLFKNLMAEPYKGFKWRFLRGVSAVTLLNVVAWQFERSLIQYK